MRLRSSRFAAVIIGGILLPAVFAGVPSPPPIDVTALLDGVNARLESFNPKGNWTATIISTQVEHDRKWRPERTIVQTKALTVTEGRRDQAVVKVMETKDGKTADVTEKYMAEQRERRERARVERAARPEPAPRKPESERSRRRGLRMDDLSEILPFAPDRRDDFSFRVRETADAQGRRLYLLDVKAEVKDLLNWEGTYTIDAETFTPIRGKLKPSDLPTFVSELEAEADFEVKDDVYFVPVRTWIKVNGGFLFIKRVRIISEEVYEDFKIVR